MSPNPVHEMLVLLRREGARLSRNRNYELYEKPDARRALKLHLMLRNLERQLGFYARYEGAKIRVRSVTGDSSRRVIEIWVPSLRLKRTVYLYTRELALLRETPELEAMLAEEREDPGD